MIKVTKAEAKMLRKKIPNVYIRTTVGETYAEPTLAVLKALPNNIEAVQELKSIENKHNQRSE